MEDLYTEQRALTAIEIPDGPDMWTYWGNVNVVKGKLALLREIKAELQRQDINQLSERGFLDS